MQRKSSTPQQSTKVLAELTQSQSSRANWKDHPVVIAAVTCAATIGACIVVFKEIVMPTQIAAISNETRELPMLRAEKEQAKSRIKTLEEAIQTKDKDIQKAKQELLEATLPKIFSAPNPYPIDQGRIRVGDSVLKLKEVYPLSSLDTTMDSWWTVSTPNGLFRSAAYYFDDVAKNKPITGILFFPNEKLGGEALLNRLTDEFGKPKEKVINRNSTTAIEYFWPINKGVVATLKLQKGGTASYSLDRK